VSENSATGHFADGIELTSGTANGNAASLNGGNGGRFVGSVSYALNQFSQTASGDVSGGHAGGGNACADRTCSRRRARRFFLTSSNHNGSQAIGARGVGFHFASLWEVADVSTLEYDTVRGQTAADSGQGPPSTASGWIPTGFFQVLMNGGGIAGIENCGAWTVATGVGSRAGLLGNGWDTGPATRSGAWDTDTANCSAPTPVWCVED
jgi:hypothetical protein